MSSRRTVILMGALLLLLAGYFSIPLIQRGMPPFANTHPSVVRALAGKNVISGLQVKQTAPGVWSAEFDYFYSGAPPDAQLYLVLTPAAGLQSSGLALDNLLLHPVEGFHHFRTTIRHPGIPGRTVRVAVSMNSFMNGARVVASQHVDRVIDWPDVQTWAVDQEVGTRPAEDNLKQAQAMIDTGNDFQMGQAKLILDGLLERNPNFDAAYVELARLTMKTNWSFEGLHQTEELLATALQIRPGNTDAQILLAYVYAHQHRFPKAEALYKELATANTGNLWLWSNWGEMLEMEHRPDQAMVKYRQVIAHPMAHDRNDRARDFAYGQLIALLRERQDLNGAEALYKQRIAEFGWGSCYSADYTRFLLQVRGNIDGAIDSARRALNQDCNDAPSRELLGLAEYAKWAGSKGLPRMEALSQARIFLPMSARALYLLAASERTAPAARQLVAAGEAIDQKDNDDFDALAYALQERDFDAVRRLLALGARAETPVGAGAIPVALLPVLSGDAAGVRVMRKLGVHFSRLKYHGLTALDFAKQQGNPALLSALGSGQTDL